MLPVPLVIDAAVVAERQAAERQLLVLEGHGEVVDLQLPVAHEAGRALQLIVEGAADGAVELQHVAVSARGAGQVLERQPVERQRRGA